MISPEERAIFRPLDEGGVILNVENGDYFQVNATGRLIWETLAAGAQRRDLVEKLQSTFGIAEDQASADVNDFLAELDERSLIEVDD